MSGRLLSGKLYASTCCAVRWCLWRSDVQSHYYFIIPFIMQAADCLIWSQWHLFYPVYTLIYPFMYYHMFWLNQCNTYCTQGSSPCCRIIIAKCMHLANPQLVWAVATVLRIITLFHSRLPNQQGGHNIVQLFWNAVFGSWCGCEIRTLELSFNSQNSHIGRAQKY